MLIPDKIKVSGTIIGKDAVLQIEKQEVIYELRKNGVWRRHKHQSQALTRFHKALRQLERAKRRQASLERYLEACRRFLDIKHRVMPTPMTKERQRPAVAYKNWKLAG